MCISLEIKLGTKGIHPFVNVRAEQINTCFGGKLLRHCEIKLSFQTYLNEGTHLCTISFLSRFDN